MSSIAQVIGKRFVELRIQSGYSSGSDFAVAHGLSQLQYWRLETGHNNLSLAIVERVASIHGMTLEIFLVSTLTKTRVASSTSSETSPA